MLSEEQLNALAAGGPEDAVKVLSEPQNDNVVDIKAVQAPEKTERQLLDEHYKQTEADQRVLEEDKQVRYLRRRKEALTMPFTVESVKDFAIKAHAESAPDAIRDVERQIRVSAAQGAQRVTFKTVGEKEKLDWNHYTLAGHFRGLGFAVEDIEDGFVITLALSE